jgi:hypothetical protein
MKLWRIALLQLAVGAAMFAVACWTGISSVLAAIFLSVGAGVCWGLMVMTIDEMRARRGRRDDR